MLELGFTDKLYKSLKKKKKKLSSAWRNIKNYQTTTDIDYNIRDNTVLQCHNSLLTTYSFSNKLLNQNVKYITYNIYNQTKCFNKSKANL